MVEDSNGGMCNRFLVTQSTIRILHFENDILYNFQCPRTSPSGRKVKSYNRLLLGLMLNLYYKSIHNVPFSKWRILMVDCVTKKRLHIPPLESSTIQILENV